MKAVEWKALVKMRWREKEEDDPNSSSEICTGESVEISVFTLSSLS